MDMKYVFVFSAYNLQPFTCILYYVIQVSATLLSFILYKASHIFHSIMNITVWLMNVDMYQLLKVARMTE